MRVAAEEAGPGAREERELLRSIPSADAEARDKIRAGLEAETHTLWAAGAALECVAAVEDRLQKAVTERDKQGAKLYSYFERKVARAWADRAKFTEFRMLEIENRGLCEVVQEWTLALEQFESTARKATARVTGDDVAALADRARKLVALSRRGSQQAAVLSGLSGGAARALAEDLHGWASPASDRELASAALSLLAEVPDVIDLERIRPCATCDDPMVRRVAFAAIASVGDSAAVDTLVQCLEHEEGIPAHELVGRLLALTGANNGSSPRAWKEWWDAQRATWTQPGSTASAAPVADSETYSRYFGLEIHSARVLFVIDRSGSMSYWIGFKDGMDDLAAYREPDKMKAAARELSRAIQALDERASFNVLAYGSEVDTFQRRSVRATQQNRDKAIKWVERLNPDGQTNLAGSLLAAWENTRPGPGMTDDAIADTIVVLSDGAPNCGPIAYEKDTLAELRRLNAAHMVEIHTVFLGIDGDEAFMRSLAEENGGKFVHYKE